MTFFHDNFFSNQIILMERYCAEKWIWTVSLLILRGHVYGISDLWRMSVLVMLDGEIITFVRWSYISFESGFVYRKKKDVSGHLFYQCLWKMTIEPNRTLSRAALIAVSDQLDTTFCVILILLLLSIHNFYVS